MPILDLNDSAQLRKYSDFVANSPHGHMMQSPNWAKVKNNWNADYVYLEDDRGEITAALSILSVSNDGETSFMYAPRGPVCALDDPEVFQELLREALPVVEQRRGFLLRIDPFVPYSESLVSSLEQIDVPGAQTIVRSRLPQDRTDVDQTTWEHSFSNPRHNMIMEFNGRSYEDIFLELPSKHRNKLRKTYRDGLETKRFRAGDPGLAEALDTFYELTKVMAARQGITHRPKEYFARLLEAFDDAVLYQTSDSEDVLSSSILISYAGLAFYSYAASSNKNGKRNLNAPFQNCMEQVKDSIAAGLLRYDLGGLYVFDRSDGLYAFKSKITGAEGLHEFIGELDLVFDDARYQQWISVN
ncbi:MAG: peptidoglycan bridge formation glycyltransferase FemA/FemB family protein [Trueperella sp.]|nr:peptidoglycan bridge formation glycyltransferase FemA/FemB family protein [Trueperella sp.]